jgi:HEAT repeat protein
MVRRKKLVVLASCTVVAFAMFSVTVAIQSLYGTWTKNNLIADLASPHDEVRNQAIKALHDRRVDTLPYLLDLFSNSNADVRVFAARELHQNLPIPPAVVDAFIKVATNESEHERVRWWALFTFEQLGQQAHGPATETEQSIIDALCIAVESSIPSTSAAAASALRQYGPRADVATEPLRQATKRDSDIVRAHAAGALIAVNPDTHESMLPVLIAVAQSNDSIARGWALHFLGLLGSKAKTAIPVLKKIAAADPDWSYDVNETLDLIQATTD